MDTTLFRKPVRYETLSSTCASILFRDTRLSSTMTRKSLLFRERYELSKSYLWIRDSFEYLWITSSHPRSAESPIERWGAGVETQKNDTRLSRVFLKIRLVSFGKIRLSLFRVPVDLSFRVSSFEYLWIERVSIRRSFENL